MVMSLSPRWDVEFYKDARNRYPVREWLLGLGEDEQARVSRTIELLAQYGLHLAMPHCKHIRGKIWELRISSGRRDYRVLYFAATGRKFILLHAFLKKAQKTPRSDLDLAEQRLAEYETQRKKGG